MNKQSLTLCLSIMYLLAQHALINAQGPVSVMAEVAIGELADKITILRIKAKRISDPEKLINVRVELESLENTFYSMFAQSAELENLINELQDVNTALWDIEDAIRDEERNQRFGERFIELARSVYFTNDRRCALKRKINELLGSRIIEEKSYQEYRTNTPAPTACK